MNKQKQSGFAHLAIITVVLAVAVVGLLGYVFWQNLMQPKTVTTGDTTPKTKSSSTTTPEKTDNTSTPTTPTADSNKGYLVLGNWGVRIKVPSGLTDARYYISDSSTTAYFIAKPAGYNVEYVNNISNESVYKDLALGTLIRSTDSTKSRIGGTVSGKKLGNYYYYTAWSFSGLASGVGIPGAIFGWNGKDVNDTRVKAAGDAWDLVNGVFLNSIEVNP